LSKLNDKLVSGGSNIKLDIMLISINPFKY
jgi:hypothetical protein